MVDPSGDIEAVAMMFAKIRGEHWEALSELDKRKLRVIAFYTFENILFTRQRTFEDAAEYVESLLAEPTTPKRWMPGVKEAASALRVRMLLEKEAMTVGSDIPEHLPTNFSDIDPYLALEAGDPDPCEPLSEEERCGAMHDGGWTCTREPHPPTWAHYDGDRSYCPPASGQILAIWFEWDGDVHLAPDLLDAARDEFE